MDDIFTSRFLGLEAHRDGQLQIALPCLHSILPKQPSFALNSAFDSSFDEAALTELADSIRSQGVLSPLLVRSKGPQFYEIVAGARRYRAAQLAGQESVPVRIVELTDSQAIETSIVENLQRRDVHPLEEAQGFAALLRLEEPKYSIEQIAAKCAKSPAFVAARLRLTELAPAVIDAFLKDEIGTGHALLLAKLQPAQQEEALTACFREEYASGGKPRRTLLPVRLLQEWIERHILFGTRLRSLSERRPGAYTRGWNLPYLLETHRLQHPAFCRDQGGRL